MKNEASPVGAGNTGLGDLFSTGLGYLTGAQVRQRADELGLTDPEREKFSAAQKRAKTLANLYGAGKGLQYLGRGYLRGRLSPIESAMQGLQSQQMASATAEPFFTRRALSNIEAARERQKDEFGRVAVKRPVEEMLRPQTSAETRRYATQEGQTTFSPEITGGLPSLSQPTVQATPTMTGKQVGVLSQQTFSPEITSEKAEGEKAYLAEPTVREQNQLTGKQLNLLMDSKLNEFDKTNFQDRKDQSQRNQPDFTSGASGSTIMGG